MIAEFLRRNTAAGTSRTQKNNRLTCCFSEHYQDRSCRDSSMEKSKILQKSNRLTASKICKEISDLQRVQYKRKRFEEKYLQLLKQKELDKIKRQAQNKGKW